MDHNHVGSDLKVCYTRTFTLAAYTAFYASEVHHFGFIVDVFPFDIRDSNTGELKVLDVRLRECH